MITAPATALIIDDEVMVRRLVRRMLEPEVCQVVEAGDGKAEGVEGDGGLDSRLANVAEPADAPD